MINTILPLAATALGLVGGGQEQKQKNLTRIQEESAEHLSRYQQGLALDMWDKTGVKGQVKAMKEAGMNPAAMYGGSGAGGQIGPGMAMPQGGQAATDVAKQQAAVQTGLAVAQMDLIKAQTTKTEAEAENIGGAQTELQQAQAGAAKAETSFKEITTKFQNESLKEQIRKITLEADKLFGEAASAGAKANIDTATQEVQMDKIEAEALRSALEVTSTKLGNQLTKARITEIAQGIQQRWKELNIQKDKTGYEHEDRVRAIEEYTSTTLKAAGIAAAGAVVGDIVRIATRQVPKGSETITQETTYDKWGTKKGEVYRQQYNRPNK